MSKRVTWVWWCLYTLVVVGAFGIPNVTAAQVGDTVSVMTYNVRVSTLYGWDTSNAVWYNVEAVNGNNSTSGPHWRRMERGDAAARTILDSGADVVGLQEYSLGLDLVNRIATISGQTWHYATTAAGGILSRHPIVSTTPGNFGALIQLPSGREFYLFNNHFGLHPDWERSYIPYAAANGRTEKEIIDWVHDLDNWGSAMQSIEADLAGPMTTGKPIFFTGDFNEPSHLDWTQAAASAGYIPLAVDAPLSHRFIDDLGFKDGYHEDRLQDGENEVTRWGYTWTSDGAGSRDDDRIDFVYGRGAGVTVLDSILVGDANGNGVRGSDDVDIKAWWDNGSLVTVSDHRTVVVTFGVAPEPASVMLLGLGGLLLISRRR